MCVWVCVSMYVCTCISIRTYSYVGVFTKWYVWLWIVCMLSRTRHTPAMHHSYASIMSHLLMRHAAHLNELWHTSEWVTSHTWMSPVTHMNESCHTHEWVTSHIWMSRPVVYVTHHINCMYCVTYITDIFHICTAWLMNMCDMTHSYEWHDSFICVTWLIHVWHNSVIHVTWIIHTCDVIHSYEWHNSFTVVTLLIHGCDMTHSYVCQVDAHTACDTL